jgi:hypothetical protein
MEGRVEYPRRMTSMVCRRSPAFEAAVEPETGIYSANTMSRVALDIIPQCRFPLNCYDRADT